MKESIASWQTQLIHATYYACERPVRIAFLAFATMLVLAMGAPKLAFTNDYRVFFNKDNPELLAFDQMQRDFTRSDNVLIVVDPLGDDIFTKDALQLIKTVTDKAWQLPFSTRVDSLTNYQHTEAKGDELLVGDMVADPNTLDQSDLEKLRKTALSEPQLVGRLVSTRGHVAGVNVIIQLPGGDPVEARKVADAARKLKASVLEQYPHAHIYLTGLVMINNAFGEAAEHDTGVLGPIMFTAIMVGLLLLLRSWAAVLSILAMIMLSIGGAMGVAGWLGFKLTATSALAPTIIMTMAVADCVHLLVSCLHGMSQGLSKKEALRESLRINFSPILVTSATTAIGFLSMNFSDSPPFRDLGNMVALGVMLAFLLTVSLLPALLMLLPIRVHQGEYGWAGKMAGFSDWVIRHSKVLMWLNSGIALFLIALLPLNELNDEFIKYFDETVSFRQATEFTNENLTGIYTLEYSLDAGESGGIGEPDYLAKVEQLVAWLRQHPDVLHVYGVTDVLKRLNKNMHADDEEYFQLPASRELAAQYLLLYEMSLPYGLDLNDQINMQRSATRLVISIKSVTTYRVMEIEQEINHWLAKNMPEISAYTASPTLMFSHIGQRNIKRMLLGTVVALVMISMILMLALRSVRLGLISLLPNLLPAGMAFGIWAIVDGRVGLSLAVVAGMTIGIVVDDTVHFLSKYQRARKELAMNAEEAVRYAFSSVGVALWITSIVLVCGFLVLLSSHFVQSSAMGLMTAITIAVALFMDFLFLPPLLIKTEAR